MRSGAIQNAEGGWLPTIDGEPVTSVLAKKGFYSQKIAIQNAQNRIDRGDVTPTQAPPKFELDDRPPIPRQMPDPSPPPDYSCMGEAGARPRKVDVNLQHMADPIRNTLPYEQPDVFDLSSSKGSSPIVCCPNDKIDMTPAQVTSIRLVRLIEAQRQYEMLTATRKVDVNLDPEADGHYAAEIGRQRKSCPYPANTPERKLWLESFDDYSGIET